MSDFNKFLYKAIRLLVAIILGILPFFTKINETVVILLSIFALIISGYEIIIECFSNIFKGRFFDENSLMFISSVVALILGDYLESILVVVLFSVGETLEDIAYDNAHKKIESLATLKDQKVSVFNGDNFVEVEAETVLVGSVIKINKGERVLIDGIVLSDNAYFDLKAITGESKIYNLMKNESVYGGAINVGESILVKTTKEFKDSTISRILALVEGENSKKAKSEKFITKFAKFYTPIVVGLAIIIAVIPPLLFNVSFSDYIYRALSFLVVSCPCALVISVPLSFFIGLGGLAKKGILVKGSEVLDRLNEIDTVVFDKTGTLTYGNFTVKNIEILDLIHKEEILSLLYTLEKKSSHPIAKCIVEYLVEKNEVPISDFKEIVGKGLKCLYKNKTVLLGNEKLLGKSIENKNDSTKIIMAINGKVVCAVELGDKIREESFSSVKELQKEKKEIFLMSGDSFNNVENVAKKLKIDNFYAELLPENKKNKIDSLKEKNKKVMFIGDGINDSPSISSAYVGVAMGKIGSELAIETADVVLLNDNIVGVNKAIIHSKKIRKIVLENVIFSIFVKFLIMTLSLLIKTPLYLALIGDVGVMILALLNSLRCFNIK